MWTTNYTQNSKNLQDNITLLAMRNFKLNYLYSPHYNIHSQVMVGQNINITAVLVWILGLTLVSNWRGLLTKYFLLTTLSYILYVFLWASFLFHISRYTILYSIHFENSISLPLVAYSCLPILT